MSTANKEIVILNGLHGSPARSLATELVAKLFLLCLPPFPAAGDNFDSKASWVPLSYSPPVVLSHVCRDWRKVALSTPSLWSRIFLEIPRWESDKTKTAKIEVLKVWLSRSKSRPFSIELGEKAKSATIIKVLDALVPHTKRLNHIIFKNSEVTRHVIKKLFRMISSGTPMLESLDFCSSDCALPKRINRRTEVPVDFSLSPRLSELNLSPEIMDVIAINGQLKSDLKMTLFSSAISPVEFYQTLIMFPSLQFFEGSINVGENFSPDEWLQNYPAPYVCHLTVLHITLKGPDGGANILDHVQLPLLQELKIMTRGATNSLTGLITRLLNRSGCILKSLEIRDTLIITFRTRRRQVAMKSVPLRQHASEPDREPLLINFETDLLPLLRLAPCLEHLAIVARIDDMVIKGLTIGADITSWICTNLKEIKLLISFPFNFNLLRAMVMSRNGSIQNAELHISRTGKEDGNKSKTSFVFFDVRNYELAMNPELLQFFHDCNLNVRREDFLSKPIIFEENMYRISLTETRT